MVIPVVPLTSFFTGSKSDVEIIEEIARRAESLGRSRISPEDFHTEKSDIAHGLRRLAGRMRGSTRRQPTTTWRSPYRDV